MKEKISVITPLYNAENYIRKTIKSVLNQSYDNLEMIIIDDLSTDNSRNVVKEYAAKDDRIKLIELQKNQGAAVARNTGIEKASGKYIAFIDSDDLWEPDKLETQLEFMEKNNYSFTFTSLRFIDDQGNDLDNISKVPESIDYHSLLKNTIIGCSSVIIDREKISKIKMPDIRAGQDTAAWLQILKRGYKAYGLNEPLTRYRIGVEGSISSNKLKALKRTWRIYREIEEFSLIKSSYFFTHYFINAVKKYLS